MQSIPQTKHIDVYYNKDTVKTFKRPEKQVYFFTI